MLQRRSLTWLAYSIAELYFHGYLIPVSVAFLYRCCKCTTGGARCGLSVKALCSIIFIRLLLGSALNSENEGYFEMLYYYLLKAQC